MTRGLVALSADPIHFGHLDLITKAREKFDEVLVLVANNDAKKNQYTFSLQQREQMVRQAIADVGLNNVRVISSDGLLADVYVQYGCDALIRGIRNDQDKQYEERQTQAHQAILPQMKVLYLPAAPQYDNVSSSMIKTWIDHNIDNVADYVPSFVKEEMEQHIGQRKIGITGVMASGKSWVCQALRNVFQNKFSLDVLYVSMDDLIRSVYLEDSRGAENLRQEIIELVRQVNGPNIVFSDRIGLDTKLLGNLLFTSKYRTFLRQQIEDLTRPHVVRKYRNRIKGFKGLVIFEWAQLAEMDMGHWTNYNVVVVDSNDNKDRKSFVAARGLDSEEVLNRVKVQWTADDKLKALQNKAEKCHATGNIIHYVNESYAYDKINDLARVIHENFWCTPFN